ncbi:MULTISPECIES: flagellar export chaperone FliS [unclassified Sphingomonas]|jgi:flagellar protein FliS|uniref:flagellar export chaperone FliS n=1 Tax=unclassified Sphingomonas TaxID=196159 RepID=UPI00082C2544|nr:MULTISPECIES: flagellar protein FliS [unclassified Sphingomonas]MCH4894189.1 flagellar export chaperone FliS [Sphingomonas sp. SFZ2018-12]
MARYATVLSNPEATYRAVDLAGRVGGSDSHGLVGLLYEELIRALRTAAWAAENQKLALKSERVTRAVAILFALENGLDFERGGGVADTLATLYRGMRGDIVSASLGTDPAPFRRAADDLAEISGAWASLRAA